MWLQNRAVWTEYVNHTMQPLTLGSDSRGKVWGFPLAAESCVSSLCARLRSVEGVCENVQCQLAHMASVGTTFFYNLYFL